MRRKFWGSLIGYPKALAAIRAVAARWPPASYDKFETRAPSNQTAVDIFAGHWASDLRDVGVGQSGTVPHFSADERPAIAAKLLGVGGRLDGLRILELGPLEGGHTYQLERLGADQVLAIESNKEAYLKCLIVKELTGMKRAMFMLGDFVQFLENDQTQFDLIFCSGVLYHMPNPLRLIRLISKATRKCFVWTHYYDAARCSHYHCERHKVNGLEMDHFVADYGSPANPRFWGGPHSTAAWLRKDDILAAFRHFGLSRIDVVRDESMHPNGPALSFTAQV